MRKITSGIGNFSNLRLSAFLWGITGGNIKGGGRWKPFAFFSYPIQTAFRCIVKDIMSELLDIHADCQFIAKSIQ